MCIENATSLCYCVVAIQECLFGGYLSLCSECEVKYEGFEIFIRNEHANKQIDICDIRAFDTQLAINLPTNSIGIVRTKIIRVENGRFY